MRYKFIIKIFLCFVLSLPIITFAQNDSNSINQNKLISDPRLFGFQLEATTLLMVGEVGGLLDYDLFSSINKKYHFGLRFSTEYFDYTSLDVGGVRADGPFLDFNIYGRHSVRGKNAWLSSLFGLSIYNSIEPPKPSIILFRLGLEFKYNLLPDNLGLIFKLSTSLRENTTFVGIGFSFGIYNN